MGNDKDNPFASMAQQIRERQKNKAPVRPQAQAPGKAPFSVKKLPAAPPPAASAKAAAPKPAPPSAPAGKATPPPPVKIEPEFQELEAPPPAAAAGFSPEQLFAMAKMGYTQWEYGKLDRARAIFQTLVNQKPDEPWFHCALGSVYQKQRQFAQALQHYNIALQLDPQDIPSRVNRGEILLKVGKRVEGVADLQTAIRADRSGKHAAALRAKSLLTAMKRLGG